MQHFARARQNISQNHHFSHAMLLHVLGVLYAGLIYYSRMNKAQYSCNVKDTYFQCNYTFSGIQFGQNLMAYEVKLYFCYVYFFFPFFSFS